jgi:ribosomal protein L20
MYAKGDTPMPRVKRSTKRNDRRKKILKRASGYFLTKSKLYQAAQEAVERGLKFAYIGRKQKKRQFRSLWIVRINAACRANDLSYSTFINGLKLLRPRRTGEGRSGQRQGQARNRSSLIAAAETIARAWLRPRPCCFYFQVQCDTL